MKLLSIFVLLACNAGCAASLEQARTADAPIQAPDRKRCIILDQRAQRQQAWALGLGVLAAGTTASQLPTGLSTEARIGLAATSLGATAGAAVLGQLSSSTKATWVREGCDQ
jgi:hypothetical protein